MDLCELCNKPFEKTKHNKRFCSVECQRLKNQRNWTSKNKKHIKKYIDKNREERNKKRRERYRTDANHRRLAIINSREYRKKNPNKRKEAELMNKYGLSIDDFNLMMIKQKNSCAICGFEDSGNKSFFPFVDHCHSKNKVRGLLCSKCNFGIGNFNDDIGLLKKAIKYLRDNS